MAINNATTDIDNITQTSGNDDLVFSLSVQNGLEANAGDFFDGGDGIDTIVIPSLNVPGGMSPIADLRALDSTTLRSYEAIQFTGLNNTVQLDASAFGVGGLAANLAVTGAGTATFSTIVVSEASNFSAAGWTFSNWNTSGNYYGVQILGTDGNDTITGSKLVDNLAGHEGDDTYTVQNLTDNIWEDDGEGTDSVYSAITYALQEGYGHEIENLTLTGTLLINGTGNSENNTLTGNAANNILTGLGGNDTINGGLGSDKMIGGFGDDTYYISASGDSVVEGVDAGTDTVYAGITHKLGANVENLILTGIAGINGTGNVLENSITGNSGNNTLNGGLGADTLVGGLGNDIYVVDNILDDLTESENEGVDTVQSTISFALGDNFENLTLLGSTLINGEGNALANKITGNGAINTLTGGEGNDTLDGGLGIDIMIGGIGDDSYVINIAGETITEIADEGTDTVTAKFTNYTLGANLENLTLLGTTAVTGYGNAADNRIVGTVGANNLYGLEGNDTIDGGNGIDKMYGGTGDDSYYVNVAGDVITEIADQGHDTVFSTVTHTLAVNVEDLTLIGTIAATATGNTLDNTITGNTAANILYGLGGDDVLDGGKGADKMYGGQDWDTYIVDHASDLVTELANEGYDTVNSSITYTLGANVENLTLTGTAAINATGNTSGNLIFGNDNNNVISAGVDSETDFLHGGNGNDTYYVGVLDNVYEDADGGTDTVHASGSFTLASGQHIEALVLDGTSATNGTGNAFANAITGNTASNTLRGNGGADTLTGGSGNDTFDYNALTDSVSGSGIDSITDFTIGDKIDVSDIDANAGLADDQAFVMDANGIYTAGEVQVTALGSNNLRLDFHTDDDGVADMTINVHVNSTLNVTYINELNFVL